MVKPGNKPGENPAVESPTEGVPVVGRLAR